MLTLSQASSQFPSLVACADTLEHLYLNQQRCGTVRSAKLTAVLGALLTPSLVRMMSDPTWPLDLLVGSRLDAHQYWSISRGGVEECALRPQHLALVRKAAGVDDAPSGNLRLTWSIRKYAERDKWLGSSPWLKTVLGRCLTQRSIFAEILSRLAYLSEVALAAGAELFIEQLTVVLAKDSSASNPCLTPRLHADEYYGYRQTAVASLLEKGWSVDGGTWFLPTITMRDIPDGDQVNPEQILSRFPNTPIVATGNGDLCIYDGMRDITGEMRHELGTAHISGDIPGRSSRLVVLMHHQPPEAAAPALRS